MTQVEIARFTDPQEAEIAAGALRAAGFSATARDNVHARVDPLLRLALGGFPLLVDEAEINEARSWLDSLRGADPAALRWTEHPQVISGLPLALTSVDPSTALAVAGVRSRASPIRRIVAAVLILALGAMLAMSVLAAA